MGRKTSSLWNSLSPITEGGTSLILLMMTLVLHFECVFSTQKGIKERFSSKKTQGEHNKELYPSHVHHQVGESVPKRRLMSIFKSNCVPLWLGDECPCWYLEKS